MRNLLFGAVVFAILLSTNIHGLEIQAKLYNEASQRNSVDSTIFNPYNIYNLNQFQYYIRSNIKLKSDFGANASGYLNVEGEYYPTSYTSLEPIETAYIKEVYIDLKNDFFVFRTGKQYIKWSSGLFFQPIDVVNLKRDPLRPLDEAEGNPFVQISIPIGSSFNIDLISLIQYNYQTQDNIASASDLPIIPRISYNFNELSGFFFASIQNYKTPIYGANMEYTPAFLLFGFGLSFYAETAYKTRSYKNYMAYTNNSYLLMNRGSGDYFSYIVGGKFFHMFTNSTVLEQISFYLEYYSNNENMTNDDYGNYVSYMKSIKDNSALHAQYISIYEPFTASPNYLMLGVSLSSFIITDLTVSFASVINLADYSAILLPEISYSFNNDNADVGIRAEIYTGTRGSTEFGNTIGIVNGIMYTSFAF